MKTSVTAVLAQSLLDAVICMGHLLLGAGISNLFFANFLWISVLKLLLFSVFQMRLVINAYQARYAQELAGEGYVYISVCIVFGWKVALELTFYHWGL